MMIETRRLKNVVIFVQKKKKKNHLKMDKKSLMILKSKIQISAI